MFLFVIPALMLDSFDISLETKPIRFIHGTIFFLWDIFLFDFILLSIIRVHIYPALIMKEHFLWFQERISQIC